MLWCLAAAILVGALLFGATAILGFSIDNEIGRNGVTTNASVTDVNTDVVTVVFATEVGAVVDITYNSRNPAYVIRAGSRRDQYVATLFAAIGAYAFAVALGTAAGAVLIHRARAARRAWPGTPWVAAG